MSVVYGRIEHKKVRKRVMEFRLGICLFLAIKTKKQNTKKANKRGIYLYVDESNWIINRDLVWKFINKRFIHIHLAKVLVLKLGLLGLEINNWIRATEYRKLNKISKKSTSLTKTHGWGTVSIEFVVWMDSM